METPTLDLPKHVTDQLHKAKNSASEVSENSLMDIIMFPLHFWTETAKSMTGLGHKAAHFGLDMAVRKLHTRGLIKRYFIYYRPVIGCLASVVLFRLIKSYTRGTLV